jgi:uncharacterized protein YdeI (YjbR/CyaY-like superfamily)
MADQPTLLFADEAAWEAWLAKNYATSDGVWLQFAKKDTGYTSVNYAQALDVALCYGWIDGQSRKYDEIYYLQRFTPRRARSMWSQINREKVAKLIAEGRMREPGQREIDRAKADGRWDAAYPSPSQITEPDDLLTALEANPAAKAFYATLNKTNRYAILIQVTTAKKPETRANRIAKFITMLAEGKKLY